MKKLNGIKCNYNNFRKRHHKTFSKIIVGIFIVFISFGVLYTPAKANFLTWIIGSGGGSSASDIITSSVVDVATNYMVKSQKSGIANMVSSINLGLSKTSEKIFEVSNPLTKEESLSKFNMMKKISTRFFTLAFIFVIITIVFDIKIGESEQRLKKLLFDVLFATVILNSIKPTLPYLIEGANAFTAYFSGGLVNLDSVVSVFTLGASSLLSSNDTSLLLLTLGVLILLLIVMFVVLGLFIFSVGVNNMFAILIIICPIFICLFPTGFGKDVTKKILYFMGFLLCVGPLQSLSLMVCANNLGSGFTFINLLKSVAGLLFTVGAIPTFTYFLFNMAQQPKV